MRLTLTAILAVAIIGIGVPAFAELQNVEVGGAIRIRGNFWGAGSTQLSFDDDDPSTFNVEQRTLINVKADFTDDVTAFIELDSYNLFGDDFRGATLDPVVLIGIDNDSETEIGLYQAYIEMREAWGYPIDIKIGRQEIQLGSEWLVGNNDTAASFKGLSFDSVLARYDADQFNITGFWARLADNNSTRLEKDDDVDFYVLYGSYTGLEDMTIDVYYMLLRSALTDSTVGLTPIIFPTIAIGEATEIHTIGARFAGTASQFDWDVEGAVQFGDSGFLDAGGSSVDQDAFGATVDVGYTFDVNKQPRVFITGSYYSGDDDDAPFNRLFSDHEDSEFLGNTDLTNYWSIGGGVSAQITEAIELSGIVTYFQVDEDLSDLGLSAVSDDEIGFEVAIYATYNYSEDLYFEAGFAHFFADDAAETGAAVAANGIGIIGGTGEDDDLNYVYLETGISF